MARVSVVIPCFNVEDKIERCINSLKNQTFTDFICYLIDDGSCDLTASIIKREILEDPRFVYQYKDNGGVSSARNLGIKCTNSEFITFIDSDDYVHVDYLKSLIEKIDEDHSDMAACFFERVYKDRISVNTFNAIDLSLSKYPSAWAKLFKTSIIKENNIKFPEGLWYEDLCFFTELMSYIHEFSIVEKSLYYYIQNENSIMYTYSDKIFDIYRVFDLLLNKPNLSKAVLEYEMVYHILVGTIFRASFQENFRIERIKEIVSYVDTKCPTWYDNSYIQGMPIFYRIYLKFLKHKQYSLICFALKIFNKHISL